MNILKMRKANQRRQGHTMLLGWRNLGWIDETHVFTDPQALSRIAGEVFERASASINEMIKNTRENQRLFIAPAQSGDVLDGLWYKESQ